MSYLGQYILDITKLSLLIKSGRCNYVWGHLTARLSSALNILTLLLQCEDLPFFIIWLVCAPTFHIHMNGSL